MFGNYDSASTVSTDNNAAGLAIAHTDDFLMDFVGAEGEGRAAPDLGNEEVVQALMEETAPFADEWLLGEQLYPLLSGGSSYQNCLFTITVCVPAGLNAGPSAPLFAVKALKRPFGDLSEVCKTRVSREVAIMRALDCDYTVRLVDRPYVNGGLVYLVRGGRQHCDA